MIKYNNINYNKIIPLGEECYTCQSIDQKFNSSIRSEAYPYDYVGHTWIHKINDNINNLKLLESNDITLWYSGEMFFYLYKEYGFKYWHDINYSNSSDFTQNDLITFIDKYNRRYSRLINNFIDKPLTIFFSVCHFDDIYNEIHKRDQIITLYKTLEGKNNNIKLIAINYCNETFSYDNLDHYYIDFNKTNNFNETKQHFTNLLYEFVNKNIIIE